MSYTLKKLEKFIPRKGPVVLIVMDGIGIGRQDAGDAVYKANPTNLLNWIEESKNKNLYTTLCAHGFAVGLPSQEDMGNSEVGHNAIGSGQIYSQGAKRVNEAIENGEIFASASWKEVIEGVAKNSKTAHFIGLLSDGNVHSNTAQLFKLLDGAIKSGVKRLRVHPLLDGRDVAPDSGLLYIEKLEQKLSELTKNGVDAKIASGGGRMHVTMDRYGSDWNIVKRGWYAHVLGEVASEDITPDYKGYFLSAKEAIETARKFFPDKQDQYNPSFVIIDKENNPVGKIEDGDAVINFNFRGDRAIEISEAFVKSNFSQFDRKRVPKVTYAGLLEYDSEAHMPPKYLVPPPSIKNVSAQYLCEMKIPSYAIAETHKFGHVTYFWNGNKSGYINQEFEKYEEVKSLPNETIEKIPEMKIYEVTEKLVEALGSRKYKFLRVNFANGDMVGHTGNIDSCVKAVRALDECMKKVVDAVYAQGGVVVITADHGNAEEKLDKKGKVVTSHTLNPVPFFILDPNYQGEYKVDVSDIKTPGIANVAATFINLLGFEAPAIYEKSLIKF